MAVRGVRPETAPALLSVPWPYPFIVARPSNRAVMGSMGMSAQLSAFMNCCQRAWNERMLISEKALFTDDRPGRSGFVHSWPTPIEMS